MRLNKFLAQASGLSRRAADTAISAGHVQINGTTVTGYDVADGDVVSYAGHDYPAGSILGREATTIMLHKPTGYVVSRNGQGSPTVYDLLPPELGSLKPVGRLDKDSSGLLLLTDDGNLANELTHPSRRKTKVYTVRLDAPLQPLHRQMIADFGVQLDDGPSQLGLQRTTEDDDTTWQVTMHEGRNRQIRRTFDSLGYTVIKLHRTAFGNYTLGNLEPGTHQRI